MEISEFKLDSLTGESLIKSFQKDYWATVDHIFELVLPQFTISEVGITHRWITHWDNQGLIDNRRDSTEWRRFSFVEYIWLRVIVRLREFHMPLAAIKQVKKHLWQPIDKSEFEKAVTWFSEAIKSGIYPPQDGYTPEEFAKYLKKHLTKIKSQLAFLNLLFLMVFTMQLYKKPMFILINKKGQCGSFFLGDKETTEFSLQLLLEEIIKDDLICINIYKILQEFFSNEKIKEDVIGKIGFLTEKEKQILELIRQGDFKELSIKLKDNKEYLVGIKRNKSIDKITNEVSSIINRNKYQEIKLITQKGKIVNAEITDNIKI
jgi:DNA-binding transcriptional MerR regulator